MRSKRDDRVDLRERFGARADRRLQRIDAARAAVLHAEAFIAARIDLEHPLAETAERPPVRFDTALPVIRTYPASATMYNRVACPRRDN